MANAKSNNTSSTREYSYKASTANQKMMNDAKYFQTETESMWKNENSFSSPRVTTRFHTLSSNKEPNTPNTNLSSGSYLVNDSDIQWPRNRSTSPSSTSGSQKGHSLLRSTGDERDQFSIYGSFRQRRSEKRTQARRTEVTTVTEAEPMDFHHLPVKQQVRITERNRSPNPPLQNVPPINPEMYSSGFFSPNLKRIPPGTLDDLLKLEESDPVIETPVKRAENLNLAMASPSLQKEEPKNDDKDDEIRRLNRNLEKTNGKYKSLQKSYDEMREHLRNLLQERKQLIKQIENIEFEEIIEEEEVQRAKANRSPKDDSKQEKFINIREERDEKYIEKTKITIGDVPESVLSDYRHHIIDHERERTDLEKRTLIESLNIQYQQHLHSLKQEQQARRAPVKHVSIQSYQRSKKFSQTVSEVEMKSPSMRTIATSFQPPMASKTSQDDLLRDASRKFASDVLISLQTNAKRSLPRTTKWHDTMFQRICQSVETNDVSKLSAALSEILLKPCRTVEVNARPPISLKYCQTDTIIETPRQSSKEVIQSFRNTIRKTSTTTKYQDSLIDRLASLLEANDTDGLANLIREILFRSTRSIGTMIIPASSTKTSQTQRHTFNSTILDINFKSEKIAPPAADKSVSVSPFVHHKASQPEETFCFDTGTITDHIFYRSQGVNTSGDVARATPPVEVDSYVTKSSNMSKASKQIKSTTFHTSSTDDRTFMDQMRPDFNEKIVMERREELKSHQGRDSTDNVPSTNTTRQIQINTAKTVPKQTVEVSEQKIEETVQILTAHVDKDQKLKQETETVVECWETVSKLKDGKLVEKKESYRDKFVSSNPNEILKHLELQNPIEISPTKNAAQTFSVISGKESMGSVSSDPTTISLKIGIDIPVQHESSTEGSKPEDDSVFSPEGGKQFSSYRYNKTTKLPEPSKAEIIIPINNQISKVAPQITSSSSTTVSKTINPMGNLTRESTNTTEIRSEQREYKESSHLPLKSDNSSHYAFSSQISSSSNVPSSTTQENIGSNPLQILEHIKSHTQNQNTSGNYGYHHRERINIPINKEFSNISLIPNKSQPFKHDQTPTQATHTFSSMSGKQSSGGSTHQYSKDYEYKTSAGSAINSSANIPIYKNTGEKLSSEHENISKIVTKMPVVTTKVETSSISEQITARINGAVTMSQRSEAISSSSTTGITSSISSFASPSMSIQDQGHHESSAKQTGLLTTSSSKPAVLKKPLKIQTQTKESSKHSVSSSSHKSHSSESYSTLASGASAFYPIPTLDETSEQLEVLLPENIFQLASQVLVWLNASNQDSENINEQMPPELMKSSLVLIDWWVDMVVKLNFKHLSRTIQYLISTFSKSFVQFLITNRDQQGNTCIHYVIGHQYWDSFSVLYSTGFVDPNIYNIQGFTVLMVAATLDVSDEVLNTHIRRLAHNANLNLRSKDQGQTAILLAALHNNDSTISLLSSLGADINIPNHEGNTPLLIAVPINNVKAVKAILANPKVSLDSRNKDGHNALEVAEKNNLFEIMDLIRAHGPKQLPVVPNKPTSSTSTRTRVVTKLPGRN